MRLEPAEEFMYKRMDWKGRMLLLFPLWGILGLAGVPLTLREDCLVWGLSAVGAALGAMAVTWVVYRELEKRIMPLDQCFLEVQGSWFAAVQPFRDGVYESCRIYFQDMESLVMGKRKNGFYIRISKDGKSVIHRRRKGYTMYVSAEGYDKEKFLAMYGKIRGRLLETAVVYE